MEQLVHKELKETRELMVTKVLKVLLETLDSREPKEHKEIRELMATKVLKV